MSTVPLPPVTPARRTVLVTGAGRRLGREIALALAAGGWQVAVHYRSSRAEAEQTAADCAGLAGSSAVFEADLLDEGATRALLPRVAAHFGGVDAVVHSAALFEHDDAASFSYALMERHARSNTGAAILLAQALRDHLALRDAQGAVVHLLDQKLWNPNPDFLSYTLSKAALEAATPMLALALAPRVRVVGVAPGLTLPSHMLDEDRFSKLHTLSPLGRSSTPADVAATVKFALENQSITGTTLVVDGGQHLMKFDRDFSLM
ncbi:SDR family oxidoreductase [Variovorax paradoxus]|uniref:SDR family oxidoreductase n=1 Tax=Variovorax paradoxus TaxID=34073 RepID=UPI00278AB0E0|nr:SDR family oxidoreductase [Variovorax paradoxus]MDQ0587575.1 NAD(P)-dependent dehydrogenase (short-subunit alcohol dehydrogenase family) [Variovorax paradoxus]